MKYALHNENLYPEPVLTETTAYASEFDAPAKYLVPRGHTRVAYPAMDRIVARDLARPQWVEVPEKLHRYPKNAKIRRVEFPVLWEMKTPLRLLIKAGDRLIAGENGRIASIAIPEPGQQPVQALVEAGRYRVVFLESDRDQAGRLRHQFASEGLEANRLQVVHHDADLKLTPYWANRVLLGALPTDGGAAGDVVRMALEAMRPQTGRLEVVAGLSEQRLVKRLVETRPDYAMEEGPGRLVVLRPQPRAGSDQWTHEAGGPGNTFSNSKELVRWPLATLWYSGAVDRYFTPDSHFQHQRNPYPLVAGGRMFLIAHEELHAIDIYTGCYLWKVVMPKTAWVEARYEDSRVYGRPVDRNYVATDDAVYVILEEEIHVYSAEDGTKTAVITILEGMKKVGFQPRWTEVRIEGDLLLAILGDTLVALNRHSGELVWKRKSTLDATTFALGNGRVIGLNSVRSGCTTSFIPAGGILTAPMLGHGCVCNYPMFASEALYHTEDFEAWRPKAVVASWVNQAAPVEDGGGEVAPRSAGFPKDLADLKVDAKRFTLTNATLQQAGGGLLFGTKDEKEGYAVTATDQPLAKATFRLALKRASGGGRHGNAFFLFGSTDEPDQMVQCRLYYGGRSSLMITGDAVERAEKKADLRGRRQFEVTVEVDCREGTVTFKSADDTVTAKLCGDWQAITHYGYGGGNSDNLFTGVLVE